MNPSDSSVDKEISPSTPFPRTQISKSSRRTRVSWVGLLPTIFIIVVTAGIASLILAWLAYHHSRYEDLNIRRNLGSPIHEHLFAVDEGFHDPQGKKGVNGLVAVMRVLTFSVIASHLVPVASSILLILVAYRMAARWLRVSETGEDMNHEFPTPLQYGLLIRLLGGSGVMSLFKTLRYSRRKDRAQLPPIFVEATSIAVIIFILTHLIGVTDIWLHSTSTSVIVEISIPKPSDLYDQYQWSVQLNGSDPEAFGLCSPWVGSPWPCLNTPEGWADGANESDAELEIAYTGWETAYNLTGFSKFTTAQLPADNSTILLPLDAWSDGLTIITSTTYGALASCKIITNDCTTNNATGMTTTCGPAGYPQLPIVGDYPTAANPHPTYQSLSNSTYSLSNPTFTMPSRILGLVDGHVAGLGSGMADLPPESSLTNNPATTLLQLHWSSFYGNTALPVVTVNDKEPSFDTWPEGFHTLFAACSLEYFKADVTYDPSEPNFWKLNSKEQLNSNLTSILWSPLMAQYATESLAAEVMGIASSNTPDYTTQKLNELLGRLAISFPAGLFDPAPATAVHEIDYRILGLYPIAPITFLVSVLYLYSLFALFIFVTSQTASSYAVVIPEMPTAPEDEKDTPELRSEAATESDALALGQMWLTDPIPFISAMFPEGDGLDGKRSATEDALQTHKDTSVGSQRLEMGVFERNGETVFGVRPRGEAGVSA